MHWFWRAAIAVVVGCTADPVISIFCYAPMARAALWWRAVWQSIGVHEPWFYLITGTIISYGPACIISISVYTLLTRFFGPKDKLEKETRCRKCGYILRGIPEPRCPECGERI